MAGAGDRFLKAGFDKPKPLLNIAGRSMIERAISTLNVDGKYIFITRKYENSSFNEELNSILKQWRWCANTEILEIDYLTEGSACTCLLAEQYLNPNDELIISDCDRIFNHRWVSSDWITYIHESNLDYCPVTYNSDTPKNSYVRVNNEGIIDLSAEIRIISNYSTVGVHYWKYADLFLQSAKEMIKNNDRTNGEFYITPTYNWLLAKSNYIGKPYHTLDSHHPVGTPQDLVDYFNILCKSHT
jgi:choline kinase